MMFALGCIQALKCNTNKCPTGVATQELGLMQVCAMLLAACCLLLAACLLAACGLLLSDGQLSANSQQRAADAGFEP